MRHENSASKPSRRRLIVPARKRSTTSSPGMLDQKRMVTFTGERRNDRFRVYLHGQVVELTRSALNILIDMVLAGGNSATGYVRLHPPAICRLRQAIDQALGIGTAKTLIETGGSNEYRVTIPPDQLGYKVSVTPCFFELVALNVVSRTRASKLRGLCGAV